MAVTSHEQSVGNGGYPAGYASHYPEGWRLWAYA